MAAGLEAAGARVDRVDVTRTVPGPAGPRERAAADLAAGEYAWLVLASPRTLENIDVTGVPESTRLAIIGPGTAHVVTKALGRRPDIVAAGSSAALLELDPMSTGPEPGATGAARRILLPGSKLAGLTLVDGLTAAGWEVDVVSAYTMEEVAPEALPGGFAAEWADGAYDVVVLTAGSSTRALLNLAGPVPERTRVVTIGTPTAVAAREAGIDVDVIAKAPTPPGVRSAVIEALAP
nr:uroporphyrinogen-III synthase [Actinomyces haliotis]